jgi:hypothetical protein
MVDGEYRRVADSERGRRYTWSSARSGSGRATQAAACGHLQSGDTALRIPRMRNSSARVDCRSESRPRQMEVRIWSRRAVTVDWPEPRAVLFRSPVQMQASANRATYYAKLPPCGRGHLACAQADLLLFRHVRSRTWSSYSTRGTAVTQPELRPVIWRKATVYNLTMRYPP